MIANRVPESGGSGAAGGANRLRFGEFGVNRLFPAFTLDIFARLDRILVSGVGYVLTLPVEAHRSLPYRLRRLRGRRRSLLAFGGATDLAAKRLVLIAVQQCSEIRTAARRRHFFWSPRRRIHDKDFLRYLYKLTFLTHIASTFQCNADPVYGIILPAR